MEQTCDSRGLASYLGALSAPSVTSRIKLSWTVSTHFLKKLSNHKEWTFDLVTVKSLPLNLNKVIRMSKWWKYTLTDCCQAFSAFAWPVLLFISCVVFLVEALLCVVECQLHVVWLNSALACVLSICSLTWHYIAGSMKCFFFLNYVSFYLSEGWWVLIDIAVCPVAAKRLLFTAFVCPHLWFYFPTKVWAGEPD